MDVGRLLGFARRFQRCAEQAIAGTATVSLKKIAGAMNLLHEFCLSKLREAMTVALTHDPRHEDPGQWETRCMKKSIKGEFPWK